MVLECSLGVTEGLMLGFEKKENNMGRELILGKIKFQKKEYGQKVKELNGWTKMKMIRIWIRFF